MLPGLFRSSFDIASRARRSDRRTGYRTTASSHLSNLKMALSFAVVAPADAARAAPALRRPCADFLTPAALQTSPNQLPKLSLVRG